MSHSLQREKFLELGELLILWFKIEKASDGSYFEADENNEWIISSNQKLRMKPNSMILWLKDLGSTAVELLKDLEKSILDSTVAGLCATVMDLTSGIVTVQVERNSHNEPGNEIPPVLPHQLVKLRQRHFNEHIVRKQSRRLLTRWSLTKMRNIEQQFDELKTLFQQDKILQSDLSNCNSDTTFEEAWDMIPIKVEELRKFCGGMATAFPSTATVESDFSVVKWEKDDYRTALTDFSLEGILHCRQFQKLEKMGLE